MKRQHNLKNKLHTLIFILHSLFSTLLFSTQVEDELVTNLFQIKLDQFPSAFNPSILKTDDGIILTFRYLPQPRSTPWISYVGAVLLNDSFEVISEPELLNLRVEGNPIPSQAEDARIFSYKENIYIIYNDNSEKINPSSRERRDLHIAQISYENGHFRASHPLKLTHKYWYRLQKWEKNWAPFVWNDELLLAYTLNPHEIISPDFTLGICRSIESTLTSVDWPLGVLRGGTPALLVDGEYLAFFHSGKEMLSEVSNKQKMWHYFMGAYTFSADPPFNITKISNNPIKEKTFYVQSSHPKRVIYPGGFIVIEEYIYVAFGKDDDELWIAEINKNKLKQSLKQIKTIE